MQRYGICDHAHGARDGADHVADLLPSVFLIVGRARHEDQVSRYHESEELPRVASSALDEGRHRQQRRKGRHEAPKVSAMYVDRLGPLRRVGRVRSLRAELARRQQDEAREGQNTK